MPVDLEYILESFLEVVGLKQTGFVHGSGKRKSEEQKQFEKVEECLKKLKKYSISRGYMEPIPGTRWQMYEKESKNEKYRNYPYRAVNFSVDDEGYMVCHNGKRFLFLRTSPVKGKQ